MNKEIKLRFAPSPTGYLHIGGLRTALFAYVIAKSQGGKLILRIEDTDQAREVEGATEKLIEIFTWLGIEFDEGPQIMGSFGPYIQSQRLNLYQEKINELLNSRKAYRCFCSAERLQRLREDQQSKKQAPRYDNHCRELSLEESEARAKAGEKFVVRQKMPLEGVVEVVDELRGKIEFQAKNLDDHVLIKSDGMPTYQFASVVDDHLMKISHVTRGEEWIPSFPKNILLYEAFSWEAPRFIHLPLILNKEGGKLSKRQNDVAVEDYRKQGYLPEALLNFCLLLGWHPKDDKEILNLNEALTKFKIKDMQASPAIFDRVKLDFFNAQYLRNLSSTEFVKKSLLFLDGLLISSRDGGFILKESKKKIEYSKLEKIILLEKTRIKNLSELPELLNTFLTDDIDYPVDLLMWKKLSARDIKENLLQMKSLIEVIEEKNWTKENLEIIVFKYLNKQDLKVGDYLWPLRVALTAKKNSPGPFESAEALGKEESLKRINKALLKL